MSNPYEPPDVSSCHSQSVAKRSGSRWTWIGFLVGASIPIALGTYMLYSESVYAASLPEDAFTCGMASAAALMAIVLGAPTCGVVGGLVGFGLSKLS